MRTRTQGWESRDRVLCAAKNGGGGAYFLSVEGAYLEKTCPKMGEVGVGNVPTTHMGTSVLKEAPQ